MTSNKKLRYTGLHKIEAMQIFFLFITHKPLEAKDLFSMGGVQRFDTFSTLTLLTLFKEVINHLI